MRMLALLPLLLFGLACQDGALLQPDTAEAPALALALEGAAPGPVVQQVTGSAMFHRLDYWHRASFTVRKKADGSVDGMYHAVGATGPFRGRIVCLTVIGTEAWFGVEVEWSKNPDQRTIGAVYVKDNGEGGAVPDRSTAFPPLRAVGRPSLEEYCANPPVIRDQSLFDLEAGNIQILP